MKKKKQLQICTVCGGYMSPESSFEQGAGGRSWNDETYHRSFGGQQLRQFACEKCGHVDTFQVDDIGVIEEDD